MGKGQDLLEAARKGDEKSVEKILLQAFKRSGPFPSLRRTPVVNVKDDSGYTPLHHASLQGHREIVRQLLSCDANPCLTNDKGATPLHLAAFKGDGEIVAMLLAHNNPPVNVNQVTLANETALIMAAQFGSVNVVTQLLTKGADVNIRNVKDESALDLAAQYGRLKTVKRLIKMHPSLVHPYKLPNWRVRNFSNTPLHRASKNGHDDVVAVLLAAGIDPNIRTSSGTPLHEAACFGKATVVQILLEAGADLNALDGSKKTVEELLADYSEEATRKVRRVIREYKSRKRNNYESEDDVPPFPIQDSPTISIPSGMKAPETQKSNNISDSLLTPSPSFLTKNPPQNFVKKLASKCLNLKAKFNSAPNISNPGLESHVDGKLKHSDSKLIGNSKFFKILSKKEESGDIDCTDEFDTISLDRLGTGTLNLRDSTVNRSNRSCPGFKTSLPNISENNELSDSSESIPHEYVKTNLDCDKNGNKKGLSEAINYNAKHNIFEPRHNSSRKSVISNNSSDSAILVNECYESYQFSHTDLIEFESSEIIPTAPPRSTLGCSVEDTDVIYENVIPEKCKVNLPTPAVRTHIPTKILGEDVEKRDLYENILIRPGRKAPDPPKRSFLPSNFVSKNSSPSVSRSSTLSSDSMIDESNLEDILLSEKSKSFRHGKNLVHRSPSKSISSIHRTQSNASDASDVTDVSAIENVDCSENVDNKSIYLTMTGTLPNKKTEKVTKKVLFRHKTFTNMEIDRNSIGEKNISKYDSLFAKEILGNYHIRGTGHCIYKSPTVQEFIYIFNRDNLCQDAEPFIKMPNEKRDSYFETAICFCKPRPPKRHNSAEDLLDVQSQEEEEKVSIDVNAIRNKMELVSSSFRCFCDSGNCSLHVNKRESPMELVVKFSAIKKSISTPDITLKSSPSSTVQKSGLHKIKSVPLLEEPYAVVNVQDVIKRNENKINDKEKQYDDAYVAMSPHSSLSSTDRPYSIKDISEVISLGTNSTSTDTNTSHASESIILRKSSSSEHSGHWSLQTCNSNITIVSDASFKTCLEESEDSDGTLHSDGESSDAETIKSDVSTSKRPWVNSSSFRFGKIRQKNEDSIDEEFISAESSKFESGISVGSESSSSECEGDSGVPGESDVPVESDVPGGFVSGGCDVSLDASLCSGLGDVRSGSGRRRWEEMEGTSEGDALSISSAASSCAPLHLAHHHEYSKVSPTPPKKPPRRNLSVSPTHVNSPSSGYSYELRTHARSQDDLDEIQGAKHYLKHGRSVDQYVDSKLSYSEYEENHNSPRAIPVPNPRPSLKNRTQPVAITAMYENVVIKEQNPRRKLRRNTFGPQYENFEPRMDKRVRKYSNQERSSLESLLDDQISPSECDRCDGPKIDVPLSPSHYEQPPTPDHPPPSAKQAENSIHERIRPLSQRIMEVVEEIRVRNKSQGDVHS